MTSFPRSNNITISAVSAFLQTCREPFKRTSGYQERCSLPIVMSHELHFLKLPLPSSDFIKYSVLTVWDQPYTSPKSMIGSIVYHSSLAYSSSAPPGSRPRPRESTFWSVKNLGSIAAPPDSSATLAACPVSEPAPMRR